MSQDPSSARRRTVATLRARYSRRVTAADVGARVAIRHLVDDPDRGPVPTDVVGRLGSYDEELVLVVDRDARLHVIAAEQVLASRVVPPHPRRPPEPPVGTGDAPLERRAARVLLLDDDQVLLVAHRPAPAHRVWTAPGGGLEPGEDHRDAAHREVREELGVDVELGPWIWRRRVVFPFRSLWLDQDERWFLARATVDADRAPLADPGASSARWWSLAELRTTTEALAPQQLGEHLATLLREGPPPYPVDVGR